MRIIHGYITKVEAGTIVNAANTRLKHGDGVVGLDKERVKKQIKKAIQKFPKLKVILCLRH